MNVIVGIMLATIVVLYRPIGTYLLTFLMKLGYNPRDDPATDTATDSEKEQHLGLGQVIPESPSMSQEDITASGIFDQKSILIIGGTRGIGYGIAVAIVAANPTRVTIVGRKESTGHHAVATLLKINSESTSSNTTIIDYVPGDLGTSASTKQLIQRLQTQAQQEEAQVRYDYLIVTAAVLTAPPYRNPTPLNQDGIEKCFGIGVVARFLLYRQAHTFMNMMKKTKNPNENENKNPNRNNNHVAATDCATATLSSSPLILNVCAAGDGKSEFDRKLVRSLAAPLHFLNDANYAVGNELMLRQLVLWHQKQESTSIPILTSHPGFIQTELLHDQGSLVAILVPFLCHFIGTDVLECGRREASKLGAISRTLFKLQQQPQQHARIPLIMVDNYGISRTMSSGMEQTMKDHGDWLWKLLLQIEAGGDSIQHYQG